jgi:predicted metal-dependent phosphotriesterase family hydrolase
MQAVTGGHGFDYVVESIVPRMSARGFTPGHIEDFLVTNPANAIAFV